MTASPSTEPKLSFSKYYHEQFLPEHQHPANIALHVLGVLFALALIVASFTIIPIWWALLFPAAQGLPGLIGHRLFERDEVIGDLRFTRNDVPFYWAMFGGVVMAARVLTGRR